MPDFSLKEIEATLDPNFMREGWLVHLTPQAEAITQQEGNRV